MDVYTHEKEQIENIKEWWRENRWYIVAGLAISAAVVGGWRFWQEYRQEQSEQASLKYEQLATKAALQDLTAVEGIVAELQDKYSDTPYASLATLRLAAERIAAGDYAQSEAAFRWTMNNTDDAELALVARARLARVLLQLERAGEVPALLDAVEPGKFAALFAEIRGDALLLGGDRDGARAAYEAALAAMEPGLGDRQTVQMKLDNIGLPVTALKAPAETAVEEPVAEPENTGDEESEE